MEEFGRTSENQREAQRKKKKIKEMEESRRR